MESNEKQKAQEKKERSSSSTSFSRVSNSGQASSQSIIPENFVQRTPQDILCGRGVNVLRHVGNLRLHLLAREFHDEYKESRRDRKQEIVQTIIHRLKASGSRFLTSSKTDKSRWVEANEKFVYTKVSHVLRDLLQDKAGKGPRSSSIQSQIDQPFPEMRHDDGQLVQTSSAHSSGQMVTNPHHTSNLNNHAPNQHTRTNEEAPAGECAGHYSYAGPNTPQAMPLPQPPSTSLTFNYQLNGYPNMFLGSFLGGHHVAQSTASLPLQLPPVMPPFLNTTQFFSSIRAPTLTPPPTVTSSTTSAPSESSSDDVLDNPTTRLSAASSAAGQEEDTSDSRADAAVALTALQSSTLPINHNPSVLLHYLHGGSTTPTPPQGPSRRTGQKPNNGFDGTAVGNSLSSDPRIQDEDSTRAYDMKPSTNDD